MDEFLKKLGEVLKNKGMSDEEIEKVKEELSSEAPVEKTEEKTEVEEKTEQPSEESSDAEGKGEESPKEEEPSEPVESEPSKEEKPEETVVEEQSSSEEVEETKDPSPLPEGAEEVDPSQIQPESEEPVEENAAPQEPVVETPTPEVPESVDVQSLKAQLEEERKAREGLLARIDGLEQALIAVGVIRSSESTGTNPVGIDDPSRVPADYHDDKEMLDSVLAEINRR